jgi:hypothetical protein
MASVNFHTQIGSKARSGLAEAVDGVSMNGRNDLIPERAADGFVGGPAKRLRGFGVPRDDAALEIDADDGVGCCF